MLSALLLTAAISTPNDAIIPASRAGEWWQKRHLAMNAEAAKGGHELLLIGDSITHAFAGDPDTGESFNNRGKDTWNLYFGDRKPLNLGISGDRTQHVIWRLQNGNMEGLKPKAAVVMIGTNNMGVNTPEQIFEGVKAVCDTVHQKSPATKILLLAIFPRDAVASVNRAKVKETNMLLKEWADSSYPTFLDIGDAFLDNKGEIPGSVMPDKLHPMAYGYRIWAMAMEPTLAALLGEKPKTTYSPKNSALVPVVHNRDPYNWMERHEQATRLTHENRTDLVFIGDSIMHNFGGPPVTQGRTQGGMVWQEFYGDRNAADLGFGWDRTENVLWRLEQGELKGVNPKAVVLMIGTNNLMLNTANEIRDGIVACVDHIRADAPKAKILVVGLLPRGEQPYDTLRLKAAAVNRLLPGLGRREDVDYIDFGKRFLQEDGKISRSVMGDFLHPTAKGYQIFAEAIEPWVKAAL
jgi:lysophospholipase L1-like esterase